MVIYIYPELLLHKGKDGWKDRRNDNRAGRYGGS
jgi:hypothetical protein